MKVGIFLLGECIEAYNYGDINDVYEIATVMTEETNLIHEVKLIHG